MFISTEDRSRLPAYFDADRVFAKPRPVETPKLRPVEIVCAFVFGTIVFALLFALRIAGWIAAAGAGLFMIVAVLAWLTWKNTHASAHWIAFTHAADLFGLCFAFLVIAHYATLALTTEENRNDNRKAKS